MVVYTINYNYKVGDYVFIVRGKTIAKCKVIRIALEVDPDGTDAILEKKRYHLQVIGENNIGIVDEDVIFTTSDMAVEHMFDPTIIAPELNTYSISYTYLPRAIVWSFDAQIPLESTVTQICFEIYQNNSNIIYNILPLNETYRVLQRADYEVFDTITDVVNYMRFLYDQALSPTPTLSVTPTETPPPTSSNTPTISPSPSISSSVTPTPTLTQTPTSSPVWD
jgi:hypothetical protein